MQQKEREEILNTSIKELEKYIPLLKKLEEIQNICTIGNENAIKEESNIFSFITSYL